MIKNKIFRKRKVEFNISNKLFYTIITLIIISLLGVGVYASYGQGTHSISDMQPPQYCGGYGYDDGWLMYYSGGWHCGNAPSSGISTPPVCYGTNNYLRWTGSAWECRNTGCEIC